MSTVKIINAIGQQVDIETEPGAEGEIQVFSPRRVTTPALANVAVNDVSAVTLRDANANRKGLIILNDSAQDLFLAYGAGASSTNLTYILEPGDTFVMSADDFTKELITGRWRAADATGFARVTELT